MATSNILELQSITKTFPGVVALNDVALAIRRGEVHALLGENGAGKSTLVNIIGGVHRPDSGTILLDGEPVHFRTPQDSLSQGIAFIHQELTLVPALSAAENIFIGRLPRRSPSRLVDWNRLYSEAEQALHDNGLDIDPRMPVRYLSTGLQQQVEICRALSRHPKILVMDEPTSALTEHEAEILLATISNLAAQGITVIFISHRLEEVRQVADRLTVLRDGRLILTRPMGNVSPAELAEAMLGHSLNVQNTVQTETGRTALEVEALSAHGRFQDVNLTVAEGEIVGIAGLLGAGKTELLRAIYGADPVDSGEILIGGNHVEIDSPRAAIGHGMFLVPEDRHHDGLVLGMSVTENVTLPYLHRVSKGGFLSYGQQNTVVDEYISRLSIRTPSRAQKLMNLSGGNQQKVILARWLSMGPKILLLDQPTRGIDIGAKEEIYQLMHNLAASGVAIIFVATEISELLRMCSRIYIMREGRLVAELHSSDSTERDIHLAAVGGAERVERRSG